MNKEDIKKTRELIKQGDIESVMILVENDNDLLFTETPFGTWLEVASALNRIELVKYFIGCGIDINKCCGISNGGPIESAAFKGNLDIVKILYENGAVLDVSTAEKNPLFSAIYNNHVEVAKFLVENGIDISASYAIGDIESCDVYEYARQYGRTEIAAYLKEKLE